jgi:coenzyme F420 hydrogenase subunit beta
VVDWGLCIGCGACAYACDRNAVTLKNIEAIGIRPFFKRQACRGCAQCLEFCPGYRVVVGKVERAQPNEESSRFLIGSAIEIWEGAATDEKMRFSASSGGALSALALYCIEKENMEFVLHTGMNPQRPWENITVLSHGREELLQHLTAPGSHIRHPMPF